MKPKIVIFGAGKGGERARFLLKKRYTIVAFSDNNISLHGTKLKSIPIVSPEEICDLNPDKIYIASQYSMEIYVQLVHKLKWNFNKLEIVNNAILMGEISFPWLGLTAIAVSGLIVLLLIYRLIWGWS